MADVDSVYLVFAQRADARLDVSAWSAHGERFFATKLGAAAPRGVYDGSDDSTDDGTADRTDPDDLRALADEAEIVVLHGAPPGEVRRVTSRAVTAVDRALADRAETLHPGGLGLLARRCAHVYEVTRTSAHDRVALRLAAIVASVVLGPIVDPRLPNIFGVKTARAMLDR